jgi:large subunit ribosomal protein L32
VPALQLRKFPRCFPSAGAGASREEAERPSFIVHADLSLLHQASQLLLSVDMSPAHVSTRSILSSFLPRLSNLTISNTSTFTTLYSRQLSHPLLPSLALAIPSAIQLHVPRLLEGIWESILRAVPKKKTSHMKKRHRQMAGKALKDVTSLNKCSACGHVKRAHLLCPYCVKGELDKLSFSLPLLTLLRNQRHVQRK